MGRSKLRLELISHEKARHRAFEKRKKSLQKSIDELSILCGVDIAMAIRDPSATCRPSFWPERTHQLAALIEAYKERSGEGERCRSYTLSDFFKDRTGKIKEEILKLRKKGREWDERLECFSEEELRAFAAMLMGRIDAVRGRIDMVKASSIVPFPLMNQPVQESRVFVPRMWNFEQQAIDDFNRYP